jgi:hypothetical protein
MRIYSAAREETLRARKYIADWAGEGFLSEEQHQRLQPETVSDLRTTNIFLRLVLFFFTVIAVGAAAALFFVVFHPLPSEPTTGFFLMIFAALCYAAAEVAASKGRLHHHGVEEALAVCAVAFLCVGMEMTFFSGRPYSPKPHAIECVVPLAGIVFSLWIWHRFGLWYALLAAMFACLFLPEFWTSSHEVQHAIVAACYVTGLTALIAVRPRHRFDYLDADYSLAEAMLWLGVYLTINLKISALDLGPRLWVGASAANHEFARPFYWTTWVLTWCLPPVVLARGIREKDRFVIAVGAIAAILTLITNKPYLDWARHTWDPMLLGVLLIGSALLLRRWLARGPNGVRRGFTAERLSGKRQTVDECRFPGTRLGNSSVDNAKPATQQCRLPFRRGCLGGGGGASGEF